MPKLLVLLLVFVGIVPVSFVIGASCGVVISRLQRFTITRRYGKAVRDLLPPGTEIDVLLPGLAPPVTEDAMQRLLLLSLFPGILLGPFVVLVMAYVIRRGRSPRLVAVGSGHAWVMSTAKHSLRPTGVVASAPIRHGNPQRLSLRMVLQAETEAVSFPRFGNERAFRAAWA
jgi:hypothetical protein